MSVEAKGAQGPARRQRGGAAGQHSEGFGPRLHGSRAEAAGAPARKRAAGRRAGADGQPDASAGAGVGAPRREVELKLEIRPQDVGRLARLKALPAARLGPPRAEQIFTVYFDTDTCALRKAGLSLRLRHEGTRRIQSVKSAPRDASLAADRAEDEVLLNGKGPDIAHIGDPALRAAVTRAAGGAALKPLFETQILRTTRHIKMEAGDEVELVVDVGKVRADGGDRPLAEVELELKGGRPATLYRLARALNAKAPLRVLTLTKADRGYALAGAESPAPAKATPLTLPAACNTAAAMRAVLRACLGHLMANEPATVERQDVEGLHQMRVALRRLRTAFALFPEAFAAPPHAALVEEARWLARALGPARDLDVFKDEILKPVHEAFPADSAFAVLAQAMEKARALAWTEALTAVASARFTAFVLDLAALLEGEAPGAANGARAQALQRPAREHAGAALEALFGKAEKLGKQLPKLSTADCHRLRRRLKRLRYAVEFFASLYPQADTGRYGKRLAKLQNTFGALNDAATASRIVESLINKTPEGAEALAWAGGLVVGWHQHTARLMRKEGAKCWQALAREKPFWREA